MKFIERTGEKFVNHIVNDEGKTDFNSVSFAGTRGLNALGQDLAFVQPYAPEPMLGITHDELIAQAKAWVAAMGGKFQGDKRCGCEPVRTAIKVYSAVSINTGILQQVSAMGPVTIMLNFKDDGTFEGDGTVPFSAAGTDKACVTESHGSMIGKVSGKAIEDNPPNHLHIELTNITPTSGATAVGCPLHSGVYPLKGGDKLTFTFDMTGFIGEAQVKPVPLPAPGLESKICVKLVDPDVQPPANDSPCVSNPDDWSKRIP